MNDDANKIQFDPKKLIFISDPQSGELLGFAQRKGSSIITDYSRVDREIFVQNDNTISFGNLKVKKLIGNIDELIKVICFLVNRECSAMHKMNSSSVLESMMDGSLLLNFSKKAINALINNEDVNFNDPETKEFIRLLTYQIIFDILYDKYKYDSPRITLNEYCVKYIHYDWDNSIYDTIKSTYPEITPALYKACFEVALNEFTKSSVISTLTKTVAQNIRVNETMQADCKKINGLLEECPKECPEKCIETIEKYIDDVRDDVLDELNKKKNAAYNAMIEEIEREHEIMSNTELKEDSLKLGVDPELYLIFLKTLNKSGGKTVKRPKYVWDYIYYNGCPYLITSKQYRRNFKRDSNTSFAKFISNFDSYDSFVESILPNPENDGYEYFRKSLDFYHLEIYKRLDFMYKLAILIENNEDINKNKDKLNIHNLVNRFIPGVMWPTIDTKNNSLEFNVKNGRNKYFRPPMFIEKLFLESNQLNFVESYTALEARIIIRAKVYELFNFNYRFVSDDYKDISNFIRNHYDVQSYHEKNKVWTYEENDKVKNMKARIENVLMLNSYLFGERKTETEPRND